MFQKMAPEKIFGVLEQNLSHLHVLDFIQSFLSVYGQACPK